MAWKIVGTAMMAAALLGCSVHSQAPIKQVAYDFSDHAYYDRDFAPSPNYADAAGYHGHAWVTPVAHHGYGHAEGSCGCGHEQADHHASRGGHADSASDVDERRPARPRVDFDNSRDSGTASGRVDEPARPASPQVASDDSSARRPRFTTQRAGRPAASEGEGRAESASRPMTSRPEASRPMTSRPEAPAASRPAEASSQRRAQTAGRPTITPAQRPVVKSATDDRIAGR